MKLHYSRDKPLSYEGGFFYIKQTNGGNKNA